MIKSAKEVVFHSLELMIILEGWLLKKQVSMKFWLRNYDRIEAATINLITQLNQQSVNKYEENLIMGSDSNKERKRISNCKPIIT